MSERDGSNPPAYEIEGFAFVGRTFDEYARMFDLDVATLGEETILDCPAGPNGFVAGAYERGADVTGVDALFDRAPAELAPRCRSDVADVESELREKRELFAWDFYDDVDDRMNYLRRATEAFLADYPEGRRQGRYVHAELPDLPFADDAFSLVLSGHFLFLYADRLGVEFHVACLLELLRVASGEVRVFPLRGLDAEPAGCLDEVVAALEAEGYAPGLGDVPFEFQRGADEMLVVPA